MITNVIQILHTTTAYQSAVLQLMTGEANFAAKQLDLNEPKPLAILQKSNEWEVTSPALGFGGGIATSNYFFKFQKGFLTSIQKREWFQKVSPPITNILELAYRPSLLDTNTAFQLATQWLANLSIDVSELERKFLRRVVQLPARKVDATGRNLPGVSNNVPTALFEITWGEERFAFMNPVRVKLLGTTKDLLELTIRDVALWKRPALQVTNSGELLGPLPPPRHFVEQLVGGKDAYETVSHPDKTELWLLRSHSETEDYTTNAARTTAVKLKANVTKQFSGPLLDFDTYGWTLKKMCLPDFGARLRFTRGTDLVEFLLCYECDILEVTYNGQTQVENFDYGHNELVRALQAVFPKDKVVKKLEFNTDKPSDLLKLFQSL